MGKIKNLLYDQKNAIRNIFLGYMVTISSVACASVFQILLNMTHYKYKAGDTMSRVLAFLYLLAVGAFFIESVLKPRLNSLNNLVFAHVVNAAAALFLDILVFDIADFDEATRKAVHKAEKIDEVIWLYIMLALGIGLYKIIKDSGLSFHKYAVKLIFGLIKVGSVFLVLNIGVMLILGIFDTLISDIDVWNAMENFEYLLMGFVYTPYLLICVTDKKEEKSKFVRGFLLYALMPLVMAAVCIIYLYIIKIIFQASMPSNEVFSICATLFAIGAAIWTMAYAYIEDSEQDLYGKLIKRMKYIYAPFVLLEIYSIGIRIYQYGLTELRYFSILFILFQIIYIAWEPITELFCRMRTKDTKKAAYGQGMERFIFVFVGIYFICFLAPFVNGEHLSYLSQKARFEKAFSELREAEDFRDCIDALNQYKGTYDYLSCNYYGKAYLAEDCDMLEISSYLKIQYELGLSDAYKYTWDKVDIDTKPKDAEGIDILGYSRLYELYYKDYDSDGLDIDLLHSFELSYGENKTVKVDLTDCIKDAKENNYSSYKPDNPYQFTAEGGQKIIIYTVYFWYSEELGLFKDIRLEGYVLE